MAKPTLIRRNTDQDAMRQALGNGPHQVAEKETVAPPSTDDTRAFEVGKTYSVPLFNLQKSEHNARVFYSAEELNEMAKSLQEKGQDIPAIGYVKAGRVILIDGQKRFQAAANAGIPNLTVLMVEQPSDEGSEYEESRRINLHRSTQTALDDAVRWQILLKRGIYGSQDELAQRLEISKANVSKTMGINRIPERLLRAMSDSPQTRSLSIAYEISCIFASDEVEHVSDETLALAEEVINETIRKELGRAQVKSLIDSKMQGPKSRVRSQAISINYGNTRGTLKVFPARGQLELMFKGLPEQKVEELRILIEQTLSGQLSI